MSKAKTPKKTESTPEKVPVIAYEDRKIRLPIALANRVDSLGLLCDLTGDQMASAIFVLELNRQGWIGVESKTEEK